MIPDNPKFKAAREKLIETHIAGQGIADPQVLAAMRSVPRHCFVPKRVVSKAYADTALPIEAGQTISQPYVVALMTESLKLNGNHRVLEIGTGSGYQAAVLAKIVKEVYSIEIKKKLHHESTRLLQALGITNVKTRHGRRILRLGRSRTFRCDHDHRGNQSCSAAAVKTTHRRRQTYFTPRQPVFVPEPHPGDKNQG